MKTQYSLLMTTLLLLSACSSAPETSKNTRTVSSLNKSERESIDSNMSEPFYAKVCVDPHSKAEVMDYKSISQLPISKIAPGKNMKAYLDEYKEYFKDSNSDLSIQLKLVEQKSVYLNESYKLNRADRVYASLSSDRPLRNTNCRCKKIALSFDEDAQLKGYVELKSSASIDTVYIDKKIYDGLDQKERADFMVDVALLSGRPSKMQSRAQCSAYL